MNCNLCPRNCNIDRSKNKGACSQGEKIFAARASLHHWEEPCISGTNGSGTVFFSGCTLKCVFCQNRPISNSQLGKEITIERLSDIFIELQNKKAHNINLVTGDHFIPHIVKALDIAKNKGLNIPVVFNTSSYVNVSSLKLLKGYIDIYLPDFKYFNDETAYRYSRVKDYVISAKKAIEEMVSQVNMPKYDENGIMTKGVIVRHLLLPGYIEESKQIIKYIFEEYGERVVLSIMNQFTPMNLEGYPEINRKVTDYEYDSLINYAISIGVSEAYVQDGDTADESFIPLFDLEGI